MNWEKVVDTLKAQTDYFTKRASECEQLSGHYELVKQYRASADTASILWSALKSGLETEAQPVDNLSRPTATP